MEHDGNWMTNECEQLMENECKPVDVVQFLLSLVFMCSSSLNLFVALKLHAFSMLRNIRNGNPAFYVLWLE